MKKRYDQGLNPANGKPFKNLSKCPDSFWKAMVDGVKEVNGL
ncbi:MAG: hypothetical protein ACQETL_19265 [Bacteroidota bacterium]